MTIQTSIQLFTIKDQLETDLEGSLNEVAARGFTAAEPYDFLPRAQPLADALAAAGLVAPSGHASPP
ncbi:sugar phosphate isomerase/epimerase, partial [Microbacterium sp. ISL-103]|nr:sugar phosphate isomerase/epimerase [Microbacterium sp. ISL-103]